MDTKYMMSTVIDWVFWLIAGLLWVLRQVFWFLINLVGEIATNKLPQEKVKAPRRTAAGVAYQDALHVMKQTSSKICCLYFLILGEVNEMKKTFDVPELDLPGHYFCKVGKTNHLYRRLSEHNDKYGTMRGGEMRMASFETVKLKHLSDAELEMLNELAKDFSRVDNASYNEVFIIPANKLLKARKIIETVAAKYC